MTKSYSHPLTYAGLCGGDNPAATTGGGSLHLWGLKDVDFRDLLVGNPLNLRSGKIGVLCPKQQIQGLLEVEPLHFTCHAASDGTRIEKIDLGNSNLVILVHCFHIVYCRDPNFVTFNVYFFVCLGVGSNSLSAVPFPQPWEPFTNMPTGEGSKKTEPDKVGRSRDELTK